jgi:hypothetical protein
VNEIRISWEAELSSSHPFNLHFVLPGQLLVNFASLLIGGRFGSTPFDLLSMKQIVEIHLPFSRA